MKVETWCNGMHVILDGDTRVLKIIGIPQKEKKEYRKINYLVICDMTEGQLIFHTLTKMLVYVEESELANFWDSEYAVNKWFLVPVDFCERTLAISVRKILEMVDRKKELICSYKYTIFTSTDCNARCFYCFENGKKSKIYMNREVADQLITYIVARKPRARVTLVWFGGEPLLNYDIIDYICEELSKEGITYESYMFTNGFLLTKDIIKRAKKCWNICNMEITLDGLEENYNNTKNYVGTIENPFYVVCDNIQNALLENVPITVRINIGMYNYAELDSLIDYLYKRFEKCGVMDIHIEKLYQKIAGREKRDTISQTQVIEENYHRLISKCKGYGIYRNTEDNLKRFKSTNCYADRNEGLVIFPDGKIGMCEHFLDEFIIGDVKNHELNKEVINLFRERMEDLPDCIECTFFPDCLRLKNCDFHHSWCDSKVREGKNWKVVNMMKTEFDKFKNERREN